MITNNTKAVSVLLVEDQESEALIVSRILTRTSACEFHVTHANSLKTAIEMLSIADYDVCLLDLGLPYGTGIESLHQIRSVDARLPIVVLTGNDDEQLGLSAVEFGAQDFVAKDAIQTQLLVRSLRFAIARQRKVLGYAADANTDSLTGMPNRRRLNEIFAELSSECDQLSVALLDVDHFKKINDGHGHLVGDQVLQRLAEIIQASIGDEVKTARFGGEEFTLLIPGTRVEGAMEIIERLLAVIAESKWDIGVEDLKVTASAGVSLARPGDTLEQIIARTDVALYEAKRSGRNRVCVKN